MSIKRLEHLKEWEIIYIPYKRIKNKLDADDGLYFRDPHDHPHWITDWSQFYTPDELKQLANDGMPKQGEIIKVRGYEWYWDKRIFVSFYKWKVIAATEFDSVSTWDEWRSLQKKTELTLAEVEEKLWLEKGSLIIK